MVQTGGLAGHRELVENGRLGPNTVSACPRQQQLEFVNADLHEQSYLQHSLFPQALATSARQLWKIGDLILCVPHELKRRQPNIYERD